MKAILCSSLLLLVSANAVVVTSSSPLAGEYVEVRTASVFAGACHYNGELVTTGRDAIMAWHFTSGTWKGVDLTGLRAMAAVSSDDNLGIERSARKSELVIDQSASRAQVSAFTRLVKEKCGERLGRIVSVRQGEIAFDHSERAYIVEAKGFAHLSVRPMPNNECCSQPHLVWYQPLCPIEHRKVGFTQQAAYTAGHVGDSWSREGENSAFYGGFTF